MRYLFCLFLVIPFYAAAQTKMPAYTIGAIQVIQKDLKKNKGIVSPDVFRMYPLEKISGEYFIHVLAKTDPNISISTLKEEGWLTGAFIGNILSARIPLNLFLNSFSHPQIEYIEVAEKFDPYLDGAVVDTRADSVHNGINLPQGYSGKDVLIGVVDWGFDYSHPVFFDTAMQQYRVVAAWDMARTSGNPPAGFTQGTLFADSAALLTAEGDTFSFVSDYHGTHVAGIAGGAGAGTPFRGIGFGADLLFSQMSGHATYSLDAFQWMYNISQSLGKRLVINNSYGGQRNNPLDGTSLTSQAIDAFSDSNVVFVFSAGNNGGTNFHIKKIFNNDSMRTRVGGFNYASDPDLWGQTITTWGEAGNHYSAKVRIINSSGTILVESPFFNTGTSLPFTDTFMVTGVDTIWYSCTVDAIHPLNGATQLAFDIKDENPNHKIILVAEAPSGTVHFWNTRKTIFGGGNWGYAFTTYGSGYTAGDSNYGIGHPGVTNSAITIAAHNTNNTIASFSSFGPRIDETPKPDISAPGVNIASALNSFSLETFSPVATVNFNGKDFDFMRISGTSMSGPMVTGVVSLLLESRPDITPDQVKEVLRGTAYEDSFTGSLAAGAHIRWGWGKVDAYNAVKASFTVAVDEITNVHELVLYPNPTDGLIQIKGEWKNALPFGLYSPDGKLIRSEVLNQPSIDLSDIPSGIYLLKLEDSIFRVVKY